MRTSNSVGSGNFIKVRRWFIYLGIENRNRITKDPIDKVSPIFADNSTSQIFFYLLKTMTRMFSYILRFGRKTVLVISAAVTSATTVLSGFSPTVKVFLLARILCGASSIAFNITGIVHSRQFPDYIDWLKMFQITIHSPGAEKYSPALSA